MLSLDIVYDTRDKPDISPWGPQRQNSFTELERNQLNNEIFVRSQKKWKSGKLFYLS